MYIELCDSCKTRLKYNDDEPVYLKKWYPSWYDGWWFKIALCAECWKGLKTLKEKK